MLSTYNGFFGFWYVYKSILVVGRGEYTQKTYVLSNLLNKLRIPRRVTSHLYIPSRQVDPMSLLSLFVFAKNNRNPTFCYIISIKKSFGSTESSLTAQNALYEHFLCRSVLLKIINFCFITSKRRKLYFILRVTSAPSARSLLSKNS